MELWKKVWREGVVPCLTLDELEALAEVIRTDDPRLLQGATTSPPPLTCVEHWPCVSGCAFAVPEAHSLGGLAPYGYEWDEKTEHSYATVGDVEEAFAQLCHAVDREMGEPAACRWFLNWFDDTPRDEMRRELLIEVQRSISERQSQAVPA